MSATIESPRSGRIAPQYRRNGGTRGNFEMIAWLFMRLSGVVLVVLIFGHLFVNLLVGEGIHAIDFGFVAGKWASPFWQWWDVLMLWLALVHGANGMRTLVNDYTNPGMVQRLLKLALVASAAVLIVLGTLVVFTFDPCPAGSPADLLPSFCPAA
jgi:succinate dehydrogenase / fumarate reductase membrane anchor subunit